MKKLYLVNTDSGKFYVVAEDPTAAAKKLDAVLKEAEFKDADREPRDIAIIGYEPKKDKEKGLVVQPGRALIL